MTDTITVVQTAIKIVEVVTEGPLPSDANVKTAYENNANTNAFTDAEQTKLTGIETAATADQTDAEIKTAYEANVNTNVFTDVQKGQVDGSQAKFDLKASIVFVDNAIADIVDSSPAALDTLNELAAALGDDANFATTVNTSISNKLDKAGDTMTGPLLMPDGSAAAPAIAFSGDTNTGFRRTAGRVISVVDGVDSFDVASTRVTLRSTQFFGWASTDSAIGASDLRLVRDAANTLALRNGTNAQDFRLYGTFTDTVNHERLSIKHQFGLITFASQSAGTGISRDFQFTGGKLQSDKSITITGTSSTAGFRINDGLGNFNRVLNRDSAGGIVFMGDIDNSGDQVRIRAGGVDSMNLLVGGNVGIGITTPISKFHLFENTTGVTSTPGITVEQAGTGDALVQFLLTGTRRWVMGIDNSDADKFKIASDLDLGTNQAFVIDTTGLVGIGAKNPLAKLHVEGTSELLRLADTNAAGSPFMSFYQAGTRRSFIQHSDDGNTLRIASEFGGISFRTDSVGSAAERMVVDSAGLVGIGTGSPIAQLDIRTASSALNSLRLGRIDNASFWDFNHAGNDLRIFNTAGQGSDILLGIDPSSVDVGNRVGIGEALPLAKLSIKNTNTDSALFIDQDNAAGISLEIDSEATTANVIQIVAPATSTGNVLNLDSVSSLTTGRIARFHSNSANTSVRELVLIHNDNTLATGTTSLKVQQDAAKQVVQLVQNAASSFIDFAGTAAGNATGPISTLTTSGGTTHHIQIEINGVKAWIAVSTTDPTA